MVIFHSYVSLPEGIPIFLTTSDFSDLVPPSYGFCFEGATWRMMWQCATWRVFSSLSQLQTVPKVQDHSCLQHHFWRLEKGKMDWRWITPLYPTVITIFTVSSSFADHCRPWFPFCSTAGALASRTEMLLVIATASRSTSSQKIWTSHIARRSSQDGPPQIQQLD